MESKSMSVSLCPMPWSTWTSIQESMFGCHLSDIRGAILDCSQSSAFVSLTQLVRRLFFSLQTVYTPNFSRGWKSWRRPLAHLHLIYGSPDANTTRDNRATFVASILVGLSGRTRQTLSVAWHKKGEPTFATGAGVGALSILPYLRLLFELTLKHRRRLHVW